MTLQELLKKSAPKLAGLHPAVKAAAELLIRRSFDRGVLILITHGLRTIAEQNALYQIGRRGIKGEKVVTKVRGGNSVHNYGYAVDFCLLKDGKEAIWNLAVDLDKDKIPDWMEVLEEARKIGFECGYDWKGFCDPPHLEMTFGLSLVELKNSKKPDPRKLTEQLGKMWHLGNAEEKTLYHHTAEKIRKENRIQ